MNQIRHLLTLYQVKSAKTLSQNFIIDANITDKIVKRSRFSPNSLAVEIGCGAGSITRSLLKAYPAPSYIIGFEIDKRVQPILGKLQEVNAERLKIVFDDALKMDDYADPDFLKKFDEVVIIGNLPFSIGTNLMYNWLKQMITREGFFKVPKSKISVVLQKEVAEKFVRKDGAASGKLSVLSKIASESAMITYQMGPKCFFPAPKVDAALLYVDNKEDFYLSQKEYDFLHKTLDIAFKKPMEKLENYFCIEFKKETGKNGLKLLKKLKIPSNNRPCTITSDQWISFVKKYFELNG